MTATKYCRCDGAELHGSDHCSLCGCEVYEERCFGLGLMETPLYDARTGNKLLDVVSRRSSLTWSVHVDPNDSGFETATFETLDGARKYHDVLGAFGITSDVWQTITSVDEAIYIDW